MEGKIFFVFEPILIQHKINNQITIAILCFLPVHTGIAIDSNIDKNIFNFQTKFSKTGHSPTNLGHFERQLAKLC